MRIKTTTHSLTYAAVAVSVGLIGHSLQQQNWRGGNPIADACTSTEYKSMDEFASKSGYQTYNRQVGLVVGDPLVCMATQQLYQWRTEASDTAAGLLWMGMKVMVQLPVMVAILIEAGRPHDHGLLLQWPTLVSLLAYFLGGPAIFASLWVASYCLLGNDYHYSKEGTHLEFTATDLWRGPVALLSALPSAVLFLCTIYWKLESHFWNGCAALLGSPLLALLPLASWTLKPPQEEISSLAAIKSAKVIAATYAILAFLLTMGWMATLYAYATNYGMDWTKFARDVWYDPSVKALLVDFWTYGLAWMTLLASRSEWSALEALLFTPFLGPGAAIAMELASLELEKYSIPIQPVSVIAKSNTNNKRKKKKKQ